MQRCQVLKKVLDIFARVDDDNDDVIMMMLLVKGKMCACLMS